MKDYQQLVDDLRLARTSCLINHLALLGCDVGRARWPDWLADPEVVVAHHLKAGRDDPTVPQEIAAWIKEHGDLFSLARLSAIGPSDDVAWRRVIEHLVHDARDWRGRDIDMFAPSSTRLRVRGLLGTGARAEICLVLASTDVAQTGSQIARATGFTPQPINRELRTLHATSWVEMRVDGTSNYYRDSGRLRGVVGELPDKAGIDWPSVLDAIAYLEHVVEPLASRRPTRGALLDAHDKLASGRGSIDGFREPTSDGPLEERLARVVDERLGKLLAAW